MRCIVKSRRVREEKVMNWHDLLGFVVVLAAAAAIPGPDVAAIVASGLSGGLARAFSVILGLILGHAVWMTAAFTGLAALAAALGPAFLLIKLAAIAYLLYLAWSLWTAPVTPLAANAEPAASRRSGVATGLLVALSNPKALVFFSAVVPSVLPMQSLTLADDALLILCSSLVFVVVFGAWAVLAAKARGLLGNAASRRGFNRVSAVLIAGSAAVVATR
jgi:threonine/homoserine/homoserine lactone efflux protein